MRFFVTLIFVLISTTISFAQVVNDEMAFFNYSYNKDQVKSKKIETITINMFISDGINSGKIIFYFDEKGLLKKEVIKDSMEVTIKEFYFIANSHGDLISRVQNNFENKKMDTVTYFKDYSDNKIIRDSSTDVPLSYYYEYDKNGLLRETTINTHFISGTTPKRVIVNKYDSLNRIINIQETAFQDERDTMGMLISDRVIVYNDNGKMIDEKEKKDGRFISIFNKGSANYAYDIKGNLTKIVRSNGTSYNFTYNNKGLISTRIMEFSAEDVEGNSKIRTIEKYSYIYRK